MNLVDLVNAWGFVLSEVRYSNEEVIFIVRHNPLVVYNYIGFAAAIETFRKENNISARYHFSFVMDLYL